MISLGCDNLLVEIARYYSVEETRCMIFLSYTALPALHCIALHCRHCSSNEVLEVSELFLCNGSVWEITGA